VRSRSGEATSMAVVAKTPNVALPQLAWLCERVEMVEEGVVVRWGR
jgi:hypothetical protein